VNGDAGIAAEDACRGDGVSNVSCLTFVVALDLLLFDRLDEPALLLFEIALSVSSNDSCLTLRDLREFDAEDVLLLFEAVFDRAAAADAVRLIGFRLDLLGFAVDSEREIEELFVAVEYDGITRGAIVSCLICR
jgi:hypothetical protein